MIDDDLLGSVNEDAVDAGVEDSDISEDDIGGVIYVNSIIVESSRAVKNHIVLINN